MKTNIKVVRFYQLLAHLWASIFLTIQNIFTLKYDTVTPSPQAQNWDEVILSINDFIENPNQF